MIGIRRSDQPLLDAAAPAAHGDRKAIRDAIANAREQASGDGLRRMCERINPLAGKMLRFLKERC